MSKKFFAVVSVILLVMMMVGCGQSQKEEKMTEESNAVQKDTAKAQSTIIKDYEKIENVKKQLSKLADVDVACDLSQLNENQKKALKLIVKAAKYMDKIFLRQVYGGNPELLEELNKLAKDKNNADYLVLLDYFKINFGPFDRLTDDDTPFINLAQKKPKGANYYPADMTKEEFEAHIKANPGDKDAFNSTFTVIRRKDGKLTAIPYSEAYKEFLEPAAKLLKEAAELIENPSLKKYLVSRADAFAGNDYYQSDIDWVDLKDHDIELVIGPYEVYEDKLFGFKGAFESFITLVDKEESAKLAKISGYLTKMEEKMPLDEKYKKFKRGGSSPIVVVNEVYTAGDTKSGTQTIAFNLPNDERVREQKGSKQVMLKNICEAKFQKCLVPIAQKVLADADVPFISFESFFNHILMHEISHGLGPGIIEKNGQKTTVNKELKDLYSTIEEAKADIFGLWNFQLLIDEGVFPKKMQENIYKTYLGGIFRSIRFGFGSAHGRANGIQLNYILEKKGFLYDEATGTYSVNPDVAVMKEAVRQLCNEVLLIEALGDYDRAKTLIDKYQVITPQMKKAIDMVKDVPTDIRPIYAIESELQ